jgi:hypothetical protein
MKKIIDWQRVLRTLVQSATGAGIALITAITQDWSTQSLISAGITFASTIAIAVLMNIKKQVEDEENETTN